MTSLLRPRLKVLLVEDNPADARLVEELLKEESSAQISLVHAGRLRQAIAYLQQEGFNAVLLDLSLPDSAGLATFVSARNAAPGAPIVVLTGLVDEEMAVKAVREGAQDYLVKGQVDGRVLYQSIRYAIERHRVEGELRVSEERFRQLAENIKEAFIVVELPTYTPLYVSPMWAEIWGRSIDNLRRDPLLWLETIHPEDQPQVRTARQAIERGEPMASVFRVVRPDHTTRWVRARMFPVFDAPGHPYRVAGLIEDITEARRTEEQFRQAQRMEAVGRLAGGIAHDFNNLLTAILGYADLGLTDLGASHPVARDLLEIRKAGQSAERLTRHLLAFSRRQVLQPRILDLNQVLERMDSLLRRLIGEDVALRSQLTSPLALVSADPGQIEQVVMNLAVNARDAMPNGGQLMLETANVDLDDGYVSRHPGSVAGPHVMLAVSDSGTGMDEETQKRLFEPFFTTKGSGKGTGLGLSTVYGIVKQSRGSVWVYSELGHGTTFKIYLPVAVASETPEEVTERVARVLEGNETVLVCEDQSEVRGVIRETLRRHGYTVLLATTGPEAITLSRAHEGIIHLLFTDVVLPGLSGRRVAQLLAADRPAIRVLYTSGYTDDAIVAHGVLEPGLAFLQKPYTTDALLVKIRDVLDAAHPPAV